MKSQKKFQLFLAKNVRKIFLYIIFKGININSKTAKLIFSKNGLSDSVKNLSIYFERNLYHNFNNSKCK